MVQRECAILLCPGKPRQTIVDFRLCDRAVPGILAGGMNRALVERLQRGTIAIFRPTDIFVAYAYGSRIAGTHAPWSDLDIGYYLTEYRQGARLSIRQEMILAVKLSGEVGLDVDLRNLAEAPLELRGRALEEGVRVYCVDDTARVNMERDLLGRYHDYKEVFLNMHLARLQQLAASRG